MLNWFLDCYYFNALQFLVEHLPNLQKEGAFLMIIQMKKVVTTTELYRTLMVLSLEPLKRLSPSSESAKHVTAFSCSFISHTSMADCPLMSHTYSAFQISSFTFSVTHNISFILIFHT